MYVLDLVAVDKSTTKAGGKAASLGDLLKLGFPVSTGFVLTTDAFQKFLKENRIEEKISFTLSSIDLNNITDLKEKSKYIEGLILSSSIPEEIVKELASSYDKMSYGTEIKTINEKALDFIKTGRDKVFVSVRTSVYGFYGQTKSFLNIVGSEKLLETVKRCWISLYSPRAIFYSKKKNIEVYPAVLIQKMINSEKSGVLYTSHFNDRSKIYIEASWGLGQSISLGLICPDFYILEKATGRIIEKKISKKTVFLKRDQLGNTVREKVPDEKSSMQVLTEAEIKKLWEIAIRVESLYGCQEIEWCEERGRAFLMQSRELNVNLADHEEPEGKVLLQGTGASSGIARGKLKIINTVNDFNKIENNDIVFSKTSLPEIVLYLNKVSGLICEDIGLSGELSVTAREFGIPCLITSNLSMKENEIAIDGSSGKIYTFENQLYLDKEIPGSDTGKIITATEILSNSADADGCILRVEQFFADQGKHPIYIAITNPQGFIQILINQITEIAKKFYPKQVWYRSLDVKTNEFQNLETEDPKEENPILGFRGIRRTLDEDIIKYELEALKKVKESGLNNVGMILPFTTNVYELQSVKSIVDFSLKIGISCDTPSCALAIEDFCKQKIDCVSINISNISQLILGVDKENTNVSKFYLESHPSVLKLIKDVIQTCKKFGVKIGIEGNIDQTLLEAAIECGADFVSPSTDFNEIKSSVAKIERKILLQKSRERLF